MEAGPSSSRALMPWPRTFVCLQAGHAVDPRRFDTAPI
jgi:hypothetical protein